MGRAMRSWCTNGGRIRKAEIVQRTGIRSGGTVSGPSAKGEPGLSVKSKKEA